MKKYWLLGVAVLMALLASAKIFIKTHDANTFARTDSAARRARGMERKKEILRQPRTDLREKIKSAVEASSPECSSFQTDIAGWTAQELAEGRYDLFDTSKCFSNKNVQAAAKNFLKACNQKFPNQDTGEVKDPKLVECIENFYMLRAWIVTQAHKDLSPHSVTDIRLVMDQLLAAFLEKNFSRMIEAADQLVRLEPDLYEAHKARVTARFIQTHMAKEDATPEWEILDQIVSDLQEFDVNDPELLDVIAMVRSRAGKDREALKALIDELYQNPRTEAYATYLEAGSFRAPGANWTLVQANNALAKLEYAIQLSPEEKKFRETKAELLKIKRDLEAGKKSNASPFTASFGFKFSFE